MTFEQQLKNLAKIITTHESWLCSECTFLTYQSLVGGASSTTIQNNVIDRFWFMALKSNLAP